MAKVDWDTTKVPESTNTFDVLPRGKYPCIINDSSEKKTKAGNGSYFEFEFEVVKGDFKKRKLWARLNIKNPSEVAQNIGRAQFNSLCAAAGKPGAKTTEALHGKHVVVLVSVERGDPRDQNRVDGFQSPEEWKEQGAITPERSAATTRSPEPESKGKSKGKEKTESSAEYDDDIPF